MVFAVDRVLDVQHRGEVLGKGLAVGDGEAPVLVLGHDLQSAAVFRSDLDAHQGIAQIVGHRLDNTGDAGFQARFLDVALFGQVESHEGPDNKKSGGRSGHPPS
ncbi:hypothetical protein D3C87_1925460 [compost metagenome]